MNLRRFFLFFLILLLTGTAGAFERKITLENQKKEKVVLRVEVADTPERRATGLMFRRQLPPDTGMLFLFPGEVQNPFWMKNTLLSLDMIFVGRDGKIADLAEQATPFSEKLIFSEKPFVAVIEVVAGFVKGHGLRRGDTVTLPP